MMMQKSLFFVGFLASPSIFHKDRPASGLFLGMVRDALGMVRDALGGVRGSSLSIFTGFSKEFEKLHFQKLKFVQNRFKMG